MYLTNFNKNAWEIKNLGFFAKDNYLQKIIISSILLFYLLLALPSNVLLTCKTFGLAIGSNAEGKGISPVPSIRYMNSPI